MKTKIKFALNRAKYAAIGAAVAAALGGFKGTTLTGTR